MNIKKIAKNFDLIVDGSDNFRTRFLINDYCLKNKKILISGAISKFDGQVYTFNFSKKKSPCLRCFIPRMPRNPDIDNCEYEGVLGSLAGIIGSIQAGETVKEIISKLKNENLDYVISYQSRVGPMKWIGPSTDAEIIKYSKEKKGIVIVPVAFVSEHSETLVELDIEYKKLAEKNSCSFYKRVPALGIEENFINGLAELVLQPQTRGNFVSSIMCPNKFVKCPCLEVN